ncbi:MULTISPECIES: hypothetical protein [unclassified Pseudofrankia]|uniref:hypothetical protein n=1 Tax=unclassified Pseudofrankia TaxID=2994372 RepID=UPI0008DAE9F5|nr:MULTISPECIES: hypothetical protein [unclassified Pseudofrankia]MDT3442942.1 hypothetical protein [Pseudofrankia sp. BMG5.37]OHV42980.1 hypothetical protein BCD48_28940 [Pseudofrankia sp. BMG5.36]
MSALYHAQVARTLRRLALWTIGTGLAVLVSWFGVQRVLPLDTAAGIPRAVPVGPFVSPSASAIPGAAAPTPGASATASPGDAAARSATSEPAGDTPGTGAGAVGATAAGRPAGPAGGQVSRPPASAPATSGGAAVRSYQLTGGRVVLEMTETSARLVSATPEPDWRVQAWEAEGWLRVDFSRDGAATSSCFVTWNGHPPTVQTT